MKPIRSKAFTDAANGTDCIRCSDSHAYACHYNGIRQHKYGKAMRQKCTDLMTAEFCKHCDDMFSEGVPLLFYDGSRACTEEERSEEFQHWINMTNIRRLERGDLIMKGVKI